VPRQVSWMVVAALLSAGCAPPATSDGGGDALEQGLVHSLRVEVEAAAVRFTLNVTNAGTTPVVLEFPSTQRYDFAVEGTSGETEWSWSADRMFAQVLGADTLGVGETVEYEATWTEGRRPGQYVAVGRVTSTSTPVELRTEFEIPAS
jgi:Intracellular proteinase inhibitor